MQSSLRLRLFVIILVPLVAIAAVVGLWRVETAQRTARDLYDKSLLITALAISRDIALRDGDAITPETSQLLRETAGGPVKYHVHAPDGVFVTGFAPPPIRIDAGLENGETFTYFDAQSRGRDVRVLRLQYVTQIAGFSGPFTVTLWQDMSVRREFVRGQAMRAFATMAALIGTVAFMVWFGVKLGLKPLLDLEEAISRRSPEDLSPIRRRVPIEAQGLVTRLNHLFGQVARSMEAQAAFISDAAHQLRNPVAGLRALGESILTARDLEAAKSRAQDLVAAAQDTGALAESLMTLERARAAQHSAPFDQVDLGRVLTRVLAGQAPRMTDHQVALTHDIPEAPVWIMGDETMVQEALKNLLDNALVHGGAGLGRIEATLRRSGPMARLTIADDGQGVPAELFGQIRARFGQADSAAGSGLGLSIAEAVALSHGGSFRINPVDAGFSITVEFPLA